MRIMLLFLLVFSVAGACKNQDLPGTQGPSATEKGAAPRASGAAASRNNPTYALEIVPLDAKRDTVLHAVPKNFNLTDGQLSWLINGEPVADVSTVYYKAAEAKKGDSVQARVTVQGLDVLSNEVILKNSPPELLGILIMPETFKPGDTPYADAASRDSDGDDVSISYAWTVNDQPAGDGRQLATMPKRGDKLLVKAVPFDGTDYGSPVEKDLEIVNLPPMLVEHNEFTFNGNGYTYQVKASDPDDDPLDYSLEDPVNGMTIGPSTGLLQWVVPLEFTGDKNVTVAVADGHGGVARYSLKITIKQPSP